MNFVISSNDNPTYIGFLSVICDYYKKLGHQVHVAYLSKNEVPDINCDSILRIDPIDGYDSGIQAKLARTYLACNLKNEIYTLLDVDQIVINLNWLSNLVEKNKNKLLSEENDLIAIGANGYLNTTESGKWPLYFTSGLPSGFRKLFDINRDHSFEDLLIKYSLVNDSIDGKEITKNKFESFSDESLFRYCAIKNKLKLIHEDIPDFHEMRSKRRIDRVDWVMSMSGNPFYGLGFWNQKELDSNQKQMIMDGFFIDSFPARPYENHKKLIDEILSTSIDFNLKK